MRDALIRWATHAGATMRLGRKVRPMDDELAASIFEKLDEYSFLPGLTHVEDCGYWGTDDGSGEEFCDCSYRKEVDFWKECSGEIRQLIKQDREIEKLDSYIRGISYATNDAMRHDSTLHLNRMERELARLLERQKRLVAPTNSEAES
jgi:hypothetical protein